MCAAYVHAVTEKRAVDHMLRNCSTFGCSAAQMHPLDLIRCLLQKDDAGSIAAEIRLCPASCEPLITEILAIQFFSSTDGDDIVVRNAVIALQILTALLSSSSLPPKATEIFPRDLLSACVQESCMALYKYFENDLIRIATLVANFKYTHCAFNI